MKLLEKFDNTIFAAYIANLHQGYEAKLIQLEQDTISILTVHKKWFDYALAMPFGLYSTVQTKNELSLIMKELTEQKFGYISINIGPENELRHEDLIQLSTASKFKIIERTCHVFECKKETTIIDRFNATRKKHVKRYLKAQRVNVFLTKDPAYFGEYFQLYSASAMRWGTSTVYSAEFISELWKVPGIYMWVAEFEGKMISAMICMYNEDSVFDWLAASYFNEEYKSLYAAVAIQYEVFKHAQENGFQSVNMGASEGLEGVSNYKDSWNTSTKKTYTLIKETPLFSILKRMHTFSSKFVK